MSESSEPVRELAGLRPDDVPETVEDFLHFLGGPTMIPIPGRDSSRSRVVSTLLHGNEPSGVRAIHGWLRDGRVPAVDTLFFVASVDAALEPPGFAYRALPERADLNRCFLPPFAGRESAVARAALDRIEAARPEALVDIHNTTGRSPAYAVGTGVDVARLELTAHFGERYVHITLRLGALVEALDRVCPAVTIECGRAGDAASDDAAREGLARFLTLERVFTGRLPAIAVLEDPVRIHLRPDIRIGFADRAQEGLDLTIRRDLDSHNFEQIEAGAPLGWLGRDRVWPLRATGVDGADASGHYFADREGELVARRPMIPIMMTTDAEIARSDCLFYVVRRGGVPADDPRESLEVTAGPK